MNACGGPQPKVTFDSRLNGDAGDTDSSTYAVSYAIGTTWSSFSVQVKASTCLVAPPGTPVCVAVRFPRSRTASPLGAIAICDTYLDGSGQ